MKTKITDRASGTGVYEGDLKYGRCNGDVLSKSGDYEAVRLDGRVVNQPVAPLVLVQVRDPHVWKKDPKLKEVKKNYDNSQHVVNHIIKEFQHNRNHMRMDVHLVVGRQKW